MTGIAKTRTYPQPNAEYPGDETGREYDAAGNVTVASHRARMDGGQQITASRSYYSASQQLCAVDTRDNKRSNYEQPGTTARGSWEEYRYNALGRRIMVRTVRAGLCFGGSASASDCASSITRFVWAGDQILWELRAPGADDNNLEATTGTGEQYGWVSYFHAGGIDRPVTITKSGLGTIVTHQNWRGQLAMGTWGVAPAGAGVGAQSDCYSGAPSTCAPVAWPGWRTSAWHRDGGGSGVSGDPKFWVGSLANGMQDASGRTYMRNRYYDPATGQFTQTDPIGLAGGLNAYGFAEGDPVSYSDPYGLYPCQPLKNCLRSLWASAYTFGDVLHAAGRFASPSNRQRDSDVLGAMLNTTERANVLVAARAGLYNSDQLNAFRHQFGACNITRIVGRDEAESATNAHEVHLFSQNRTQSADSNADLQNNSIGMRAEASERQSGQSCEAIADENIRMGNYAER